MNTLKALRASIFLRISNGSYSSQNKKSLPKLVRKGQIGGWAVATRSFPLQPFGTHSVGRLLPDAILRDFRSCRPHSRAVQGLAAHGLLGEVYLPAQPVVAATDMRTRLDTQVIRSHPSPLEAGQPSLVTMRSPVPRVSPLNPQIAISFTLQRCSFCRIATVSDSFHDRRLGRVAIPTETPAFVLLSEDFVRLAVSGQFAAPAVLISQ